MLIFTAETWYGNITNQIVCIIQLIRCDLIRISGGVSIDHEILKFQLTLSTKFVLFIQYIGKLSSKDYFVLFGEFWLNPVFFF